MLKNKTVNMDTLKKKTIRRGLYIIILASFVLVSVLFISPSIKQVRSNFRSSQLTKVTARNEDIERTDYVDKNGKITYAADMGYASSSVTKTENGELEQYYDEYNNPVKRSNGYYAVLRQYDNKGNNVKNTYLDADNIPMMTLSGYAIVVRDYNESGQVKSIRYYDTAGNPVCTRLYGYGRVYERDENGMKSRTIYIDAHGEPMMTEQGYASIVSCYYTTNGQDEGKVESEFYYDEKGKPISLSLGQYGVHKEYDENGQERLITYLDSNGKPMVTSKGYTTITRTYQANKVLATEQYYDLNGNPFALSEGQYGITIKNGQTIYLNRNGGESFNLKNLLYNHSWTVIPLVIIIVIVSSINGKRMNILFLVMYICAIGYMTLMFRENNGNNKMEFFSYYRRFFSDDSSRADIIRNIWLFIPLGTILYKLYPNKIILLGPVILSILIESVQFFSGIGICELDDVINNGLGGVIGFYTEKLTMEFIQRIKSWRHTHIA